MGTEGGEKRNALGPVTSMVVGIRVRWLCWVGETEIVYDLDVVGDMGSGLS